MQLTNQVKQSALLAELAYLKLEDKYWTTPDEYGKIPSYSNYDDLKTFLEKNPKSITDINDSSDSAMLTFKKGTVKKGTGYFLVTIAHM